MISVQEAIHNVATSTKPPKHMRTRGKKSFATVIDERRLLDAIAKRGADPCDVLARIISDDYCGEISLEKRGDVTLKVMKFLLAEKKAVEHTGKDGAPLQVILSAYDERL